MPKYLLWQAKQNNCLYQFHSRVELGQLLKGLFLGVLGVRFPVFMGVFLLMKDPSLAHIDTGTPSSFREPYRQSTNCHKSKQLPCEGALLKGHRSVCCFLSVIFVLYLRNHERGKLSLIQRYTPLSFSFDLRYLDSTKM